MPLRRGCTRRAPSAVFCRAGHAARWRTPPDAAAFSWDADTRIDSGVQEGDEVRGRRWEAHTLVQGMLLRMRGVTRSPSRTGV